MEKILFKIYQKKLRAGKHLNVIFYHGKNKLYGIMPIKNKDIKDIDENDIVTGGYEVTDKDGKTFSRNIYAKAKSIKVLVIEELNI